jgi:hypothetical protein
MSTYKPFLMKQQFLLEIGFKVLKQARSIGAMHKFTLNLLTPETEEYPIFWPNRTNHISPH